MLGTTARFAVATADELPIALPTQSQVDAHEVRVRITVLVPAHDERLVIAHALRSLQEQTRPPDRVIVVADNCTDDTAEIARSCGASVIETVANTEKKAGALNQVLAGLLPAAEIPDVVMVMDADTTLVPRFLEIAAARLEADPDLIAVGGIFEGEAGGGLVGQSPAQRVRALPASHRTAQGPSLRADRDRVALSRLRAARGRRCSRPDPPRSARKGLRHLGDDRGQRARPWP